MRALVVVASKYGATLEIGHAIQDQLAARGIQATLHRAERMPDVEDHDAVVLGSAVYLGRWLPSARAFVRARRAALAARPVWLFSSGPVGGSSTPDEPPVEVGEVAAATRAREHRVFGGKLDRAHLTFADKAVAIAMRAPQGDWRDFGRIRAWADAIALELADAQRAKVTLPARRPRPPP